jgi:hypothetical protein
MMLLFPLTKGVFVSLPTDTSFPYPNIQYGCRGLPLDRTALAYACCLAPVLPWFIKIGLVLSVLEAEFYLS